jgi:hypothetical protein
MGSALRRALLLVVLPSALVACGLDADESDAASSLSAALGGTDTDECVAEKWVGQLGTTPLVADGVLTDDLDARRPFVTRFEKGTQIVSGKVAQAYAAAWIACEDLDAMALERKDDTDASAEELDEYADCLKGIDDDEWRQAIADRGTGLTESSAIVGLARDLTTCEKELE